jgi:release factor glutamine methyltransferase
MRRDAGTSGPAAVTTPRGGASLSTCGGRYLAGVPRSPDRLIGRTSVRDALDSAVIALTAAGCDTPRLDAELLLAAAMGVDRAVIVSDPGHGIEPDAARRFMEYAARRREREPVAYILGTKGFRSIELDVDPRVLIPRPETEHLVEALLDLPQGSRVCDVGTGSGAIALALKAERPDLDVVATDSSADALAVAQANARRLGLNVTFRHGDLLAGAGGRLDAVVSNPPYVEDGAELGLDIVRHEPALALRAGPSGLDVISRLLPSAGATDAHTVGAGQSVAVAELVRGAGFPRVESVTDLAGIERVLVGRRP